MNFGRAGSLLSIMRRKAADGHNRGASRCWTQARMPATGSGLSRRWRSGLVSKRCVDKPGASDGVGLIPSLPLRACVQALCRQARMPQRRGRAYPVAGAPGLCPSVVSTSPDASDGVGLIPSLALRACVQALCRQARSASDGVGLIPSLALRACVQALCRQARMRSDGVGLIPSLGSGLVFWSPRRSGMHPHGRRFGRTAAEFAIMELFAGWLDDRCPAARAAEPRFLSLQLRGEESPGSTGRGGG